MRITSSVHMWVTEQAIVYGVLKRGKAYLVPTWLWLPQVESFDQPIMCKTDQELVQFGNHLTVFKESKLVCLIAVPGGS